MSSLEKHLPFVNDQAAYHEKQAAFFESKKDSFRQKKHLEQVKAYRELSDDIVLAASEASIQPPAVKPRQLRLSLSPDDIKDLPQELLAELSVGGDLVEFAIMEIIQENGGAATLDQLLIGLYRKTKEIHKRQALTTRLYRMGQKNNVFNVPGRKGVYSVEPMSNEEAASLLDRDNPGQSA
jgi:hypothetical protein